MAPLIISMATRSPAIWEVDAPPLGVHSQRQQERAGCAAAAGSGAAGSRGERAAGGSRRRLFSCHIISSRAVNKGAPRSSPGRCTAARKSVHGPPPPPLSLSPALGSTAVNNVDIVRPPPYTLHPPPHPPRTPRAVTGARAAAAQLALFIPGQMGTKWPFMQPKDRL
ncbi:hypothetical protein EYF80_056813 [Liparis tanakae]|uniref:Uncharacterized protein n=1 Tax=Liparis tanakae TaxID=230148 RepID=A0A4Z2EW58_9TELE|nr:hypothetical protein EYF80_056813 [Liparis tanakae]